ncbi:unnamed protein product, partial [marine sediment metagenome]
MNWKKELKNSICTIDQLKEYVDLSWTEERELKRMYSDASSNRLITSSPGKPTSLFLKQCLQYVA